MIISTVFCFLVSLTGLTIAYSLYPLIVLTFLQQSHNSTPMLHCVEGQSTCAIRRLQHRCIVIQLSPSLSLIIVHIFRLKLIHYSNPSSKLTHTHNQFVNDMYQFLSFLYKLGPTNTTPLAFPQT